MPIKPIPETERCSKDLARGAEPVIIRGAARSWMATSRWSITNLGKRFPHARLPVRFDEGVWWWTLGALAQAIDKGERVHGIDWDYKSEFPELASELGNVPLSSEDCFLRIPVSKRPRFDWLYIGAAGTGSPLHQDLLATHSWLAVCEGSKRWVMFPPQTRFSPDVASASRMDEKADPKESEECRTRYEGIVNKGDVIFEPSMWWHEVQNVQASISITHNFCHPIIRGRVRESAREGQSWPGESEQRDKWIFRLTAARIAA